MVVKMDLIKTITEGEEVPNYSESSDEEEEFQPSKQKVKKKKDFDSGFEFVGSLAEYNKDTWDDVFKYIKRKANNKLDEKISKARKRLRKEKREEQTDGVKDEAEDDKEGEEEVVKEETDSEDESKEIIEIGEGSDSDSDSDSEGGVTVSDSEGEEQDSKEVDPAENESDLEDEDDASELSDDELVKDNIRVKEKQVGKKKRKKLKNKEEEKMVFEDAPQYDESISFYDMNLSRPILKAIQAMNFINPTPIQSATISVALEGRDICGCAATGTGKTLAYMVPTLERLVYRPLVGSAVTRVLVLVPTRELGVQVYQVSKQLAQHTSIQFGLAVGGLDLKVQESVLRKSPDVVIATPGRLIDHLRNTPSFTLDSVEVLILDEADRMLDECFEEQMKEIVKECSRTRQTMLFSATMTEAVESLAAVSLSKPVRVFVDSNQQVANNLRQEFIKIRKEREGDREPVLAALICRTFHDHAMVFVQTKRQAHRLHILLGLLGVKVGELHGDLTQTQRLEALRRFKEEESDVLVATDVAARGLDIRGVRTVVNFVVPATVEQYIHRVGRTARAGRSGVSVSLAGEHERKTLQKILAKSKSVKARTIPPEIIEKYKKKLAKLEPKIKEILEEEWQEKALARAEAQANKAEKMIKGEDGMERKWFQSHHERKQEREKLMLKGGGDDKKGKDKGKSGRYKKGQGGEGKGKGGGKAAAEVGVERELEKVALYQARLAKRSRKPARMKAVVDRDNAQRQRNGKPQQKGGVKRKKSSFAEDLTDVSGKNVKRIRHEATHERNAEMRERRRGVRGGQKNKQKMAKRKK